MGQRQSPFMHDPLDPSGNRYGRPRGPWFDGVSEPPIYGTRSYPTLGGVDKFHMVVA